MGGQRRTRSSSRSAFFAAVLVGGICVHVATAAAVASPPTSVTTTFTFTSAAQSYSVPTGVRYVGVETWGAQGGSTDSATGGLGGHVRGTFAVTPGEILRVRVGGSNGFNGGGAAGPYGAAGGGATDVRQGGDGLVSRVIVAGGGGGGGFTPNPNDCPVPGGIGGGSSGGTPEDPCGAGPGGGATQTAGGTSPCAGSQGTLGTGGSGCAGGGGGGGLYGGGGAYGGFFDMATAGAGGGGGSGYVAASADGLVADEAGIQGGDGAATITPASAPSAPVGVFAFPGDAQATVGWSPPTSDNGFPITGYVVRAYIGGVLQSTATVSSTVRSYVFSGLANGTSYTFTVAATNFLGTGTESPPVSVTVGTPLLISRPSALPGDGSGCVSWGGVIANGSPITGYVVTPFINGVAQTKRSYASTATTEAVTGLTNGTTYTFSVAGKNANGTGPNSAASAPVTVGIPTAPRSPSAVPGNGQATVSWVRPTSDTCAPATGYVVSTYLGSGALQSQSVFSSPATTEVITSLNNGTLYNFKIAAKNAAALTGPQSVATGVIVGTPTAPRSPSAVPGYTSATVRWTAPASSNGSPVTGYVVTPYVNGIGQAAHFYSSAATTETVTGLTNSTTYTFKIAAKNARGTGPQSVATAPITVGTPSAPRSPSSVPGNGQAFVSWLAPSSDGGSAISGYVVTPYVAGTAQTPHSYSSTATTQAVTGLTNGTTYTFKIAASNARGTGPQSVATALVTVGTPSAPRWPSAAPGNMSATVTWTVPLSSNGSPISGYVITPYASGVAQTPHVYNSTATTESVTGLTNGTSYTFKVAAKNVNGTGPQSVATGAIIVGTPTAPTGVSATAGAGSATVHWTAPSTNNGSGITAYIVTPYIGTAAQPPWIFNSTATTETISGLTSGTTYTFKVAAKNANGTGPQSVPSNPVTPT
jgi:hypothetical protein